VSNLRRVPYTKPIPEGAQLFTRKGERFARFKDRRGKTVDAPLTEDGSRIRLLSKKWYGEYRDADGVERCVPLATDKTAAEQMLAALVRKSKLGKAGVSGRRSTRRCRRAGRQRPGPAAWSARCAGRQPTWPGGCSRAPRRPCRCPDAAAPGLPAARVPGPRAT
jgi:hypothetical protein